MRTDVTTSKKQSEYLANASTLGYGKYKAQFGDIVIYRENENTVRVARVAGRIEHCPKLDDDPNMKGWLIVVALGMNLTHTMERWINPDDVIECFNPSPDKFGGRDIIALLSFFFGEDFKKHSTDELRQWANAGTNAPIK